MELEYANIIDIIQYAVDDIAEQVYDYDAETPPRFTVSLHERRENGKPIAHEIILTVDHHGSCHSRTIFPKLEYTRGYESLQDEMKWLFNTTM